MEKEKDDFFGDVISSYSVDDAVEDGVFYEAGKFSGFRLVITSNLLDSIEKTMLAAVLVEGLSRALPATLAHTADLVVAKVEGKVIWVDINPAANAVTFMLPEDY